MTGINRKNRSSLKYPDLESARRPVAHYDDIPVPVFREPPDISNKDPSSVPEDEEKEEEVVLNDDAPHPFSQKELNDLVQLVKVLCQAIGIQIEGKEPPLWQWSHHLLP